jgi:hypothetical protein
MQKKTRGATLFSYTPAFRSKKLKQYVIPIEVTTNYLSMTHRYPTRFQTNSTQAMQTQQPQIQEEIQEEVVPQDTNPMVSYMLNRIDTSTSYTDKVAESIKLFEYLYSHDAVFTSSFYRFKDVIWQKMGHLDDDLADALYRIPATIDPCDRHARTNTIHLLDMINRVREKYYY